MPVNNILSSLRVVGQFALNPKTHFKTIAEMIDLGASDANAFTYYESLIALCSENEKQYIWREYDAFIDRENEGLISGGFTYPADTIADGIDYSLRTFNFYEYKEDYVTFADLGGDTRITSGFVVWQQNLDYQSTIITAIFEGVDYAAPVTQLTLANGDAAFDRIDVFAFDISVPATPTIVVVPGTPALYPLEPTIDFTNQIRISAVTVAQNATTPFEVFDRIVYDENLGTPNEFNATENTATARINVAAVSDPQIGTTHIEVTDGESDDTITLTDTGTPSMLGVSSFTCMLQNKVDADYSIKILLYNGATLISSPAFVLDASHGFDLSVTEVYNVINVPISEFQLTSPDFTTIELVFTNESGDASFTGCDIDRIRLISGEEVPIPLNTYLGLDDTDDTNYTGKVNYAPLVNNVEDGLVLTAIPMFSDLYSPNDIINGGISHIINLDYYVWSTGFVIDSVVTIENINGNVTLSPAHPTLLRWNVFVINGKNPAEGTVTLDTGASGSVDSITVDGVELLTGSIPFNTDLATTVFDVVHDIIDNNTTTNYSAKANGNVITIVADDGGTASNGFVVVSTCTTITSTDVNLSGGTELPSVGVLEGIAEAAPQKPNVNLTNQVEVGEKLLAAGETSPPEVTTTLVYAENLGDPTEWDGTYVAGFDGDYLVNPDTGTKSIQSIAISNKRKIGFNDLTMANFNAIDGHIRLRLLTTTSWANNQIRFGYVLRNSVTLEATAEIKYNRNSILALGFQEFATNIWQTVIFPMSDAGYPGTEFDTIQLVYERTPSLQVDEIYYQEGTGSPPNTNHPEYRIETSNGNNVILKKDSVTIDDIALEGKEITGGTVIDLTSSLGTNADFDAANTSLGYTIGPNAIVNGWERRLINATEEPVIVGAVQEGGVAFTANEEIYLTTWNKGTQGVVYSYSGLAVYEDALGGVRQRKVISIVDNTLAPPTEVLGDRYILDTTGVSHADWDGALANDIVEFDGTFWQAYTPEEGWNTYVDADDKDARFIDDGVAIWELVIATVPTLQAVTDVGNITTNSMSIGPGTNTLTSARVFAIGQDIPAVYSNSIFISGEVDNGFTDSVTAPEGYQAANLLISDVYLGKSTILKNQIFCSIISGFGNVAGVDNVGFGINDFIVYASLISGIDNEFTAAKASGLVGAGLKTGASRVFIVGSHNRDITQNKATVNTGTSFIYNPRFIVGTSTDYNETTKTGTPMNGFIVMSDGHVSAPELTIAKINAPTVPLMAAGTTDSTLANNLVDSTALFLTTVQVGDIVRNTTDVTTAIVTVVVSDTTLTLDTDIMITGEDYEIDLKNFADRTLITKEWYNANNIVEMGYAASDELSDLEVKDEALRFRMPFAMTLTNVIITANDGPDGSTLICDLTKNGTTVLSTLVSIDAQVSAFGTVTCVSAIVGNTVTVNGLLYTAVAGVKSDNTEFSIDTSDTATATDLADSITNDTRAGTLNDVTATSSLGVVTITQTIGGEAGNATTLASSGGTLAVSGAVFTGGVTEETSNGAAVPVVVSVPTLEIDSEISLNIDQVGSINPGKGLKVWLIGNKI